MISLSKGQTVSLAKSAPGASKFIVGAGWDVKRGDTGLDFDIDIMAIAVGKDGKVRNETDFFYYGLGPKDDLGNLIKGKPFANADGYLFHKGDNRDGQGDGDDEQMVFDSSKVPEAIDKVVILLTIFDAETRKQQFGSIENTFVRVVDANDENNVDKTIRYEPNEEFSTETVVAVAEFYRYQGEWKLRAKGEGFNGGIVQALASYGLQAS